MTDTTIEWTGKTLNHIRARRQVAEGRVRVGHHCEKVSPGCRGCYAEAMNGWRGTGLPYKPAARDAVELYLDEKVLAEPLRTKRANFWFPCSMTDLFADFVPEAWIDRTFDMMEEAAKKRGHIFQVLTKRSGRMRAYASRRYETSDPPAGVWLGVSVEDKRRKERIEDLRATPASLRWISFEPLLEDLGALDLRGISWAIFGGESGRRSRVCNLRWIRRGVAQCREQGVAPFVKQLGRKPVYTPSVEALVARAVHGATSAEIDRAAVPIKLRHRKGGDPAEWPEAFPREMPPGYGFSR